MTLLPLELVEAQYVSRDSAGVELPDVAGLKAAIRIRLRATAGLPLNKLKLDRLPLFIRGMGERPMQIYEQIMAGCAGRRPAPRRSGPAPGSSCCPAPPSAAVGFDDDQALLPAARGRFRATACWPSISPARSGSCSSSCRASPAQSSIDEQLIDIFILLDRYDPQLEAYVGGQSFAPVLHAGDQPVSQDRRPDSSDRPRPRAPRRARPHAAARFRGLFHQRGGRLRHRANEEQTFLPFYATSDLRRPAAASGPITRCPDAAGSVVEPEKSGPRSSYIGSEVYLSPSSMARKRRIATI